MEPNTLENWDKKELIKFINMLRGQLDTIQYENYILKYEKELGTKPPKKEGLI